MPRGREATTLKLAAQARDATDERNAPSAIRQFDFYGDTLSAKLGHAKQPGWQRTEEGQLDD